MTAAFLSAASRHICDGRRVIATDGRSIHALPRYVSPWPGRWVRVAEQIDETEAAQILAQMEAQ